MNEKSAVARAQARLEAAETIGALLDAAWGAFTVLLAGCRAGEDQDAAPAAAFSFAAVAAAQGRRALALAPSLPTASATPAGHRTAPGPGPHGDRGNDNGEGLTGLANALAHRLAAAARTAPGASDRLACGHAAESAAHAARLLSGQ